MWKNERFFKPRLYNGILNEPISTQPIHRATRMEDIAKEVIKAMAKPDAFHPFKVLLKRSSENTGNAAYMVIQPLSCLSRIVVQWMPHNKGMTCEIILGTGSKDFDELTEMFIADYFNMGNGISMVIVPTEQKNECYYGKENVSSCYVSNSSGWTEEHKKVAKMINFVKFCLKTRKSTYKIET